MGLLHADSLNTNSAVHLQMNPMHNSAEVHFSTEFVSFHQFIKHNLILLLNVIYCYSCTVAASFCMKPIFSNIPVNVCASLCVVTVFIRRVIHK